MIVGDPADEETELGALISAAHRDKVMSYIDLAEDEGGDILCGGGPQLGSRMHLQMGFGFHPL